MKQTKCK